MKNYDIVIIGGGIGGLMAAYKSIINNNKLKIIILEKGRHLLERKCPILENKSHKCMNCNPCSIMNGLAGAGAFSDGKFIISTEYGGHLQKIIGDDLALNYMEKLDNILINFGAPTDFFMPDSHLIELCKKNNLLIKNGKIKHFGTENNLKIMSGIIDFLKKHNVDIKCLCDVNDINPTLHKIYIKNDIIYGKHIIFSIGRSGSKFFKNWCDSYSIKTLSQTVDIGVRLELDASIWKKITAITYDPKISYISKKYQDETRIFCFIEKGFVVVENTSGKKTVNGHAYKNKKSSNSNFALLTNITFTDPFNNSIEYINAIVNIANFISDGGIIVQKFGDLINGKRTTDKKLSYSHTIPTLKAYPGDLSLCLPKRQLDNIIETIKQLNFIAPGTADDETLLYGVEAKYYSSIPDHNNLELNGYKGIYICGDGCGITRSLAQAGANGLYLADLISQ